MAPYAECVKPTMKQPLTLFLSVLNFFKKNTYDNITEWEAVHADICRKKGFTIPEKCYKHILFPENESSKILWDFNIQTDNITEHRRPDMIIIDKTSKKAQIVGLDVPADHRIKISQF